jgi:hypothetical protein
MARLLSLRIDVPRDRGEAFPGDIFERRAIGISPGLFCLTERYLKGSGSAAFVDFLHMVNLESPGTLGAFFCVITRRQTVSFLVEIRSVIRAVTNPVRGGKSRPVTCP